MKKILQSEPSQLIAFVAAVLISRVPFLFSGYGLDADSWEMAITARHISQSGVYEVSRFPGFPVEEIISSLFFNGRYVSLNLLTTIISTTGFLFFVLALKALRFKESILAGFALAAVPVVYIYSSVTIDYEWALAFILIALYFVITSRPVFAGLFLGIAIGCRITSGAMLLPFAIMISKTDGTIKNFKRIVLLAAITCLTGSLLFLPVYIRYGTAFFSYVPVPYPSIAEVLYKFSIDVWGIAGCIAILAGTAILLLPSGGKERKYLFPRSVNEKYIVAWLVAIDLYIIAYLKLPMEAGYLVPIVPFVILVFGKYLYDNAFKFFCLALIAASFIGGIAPSERNDAPTPSPLAVTFKAAGEQLLFDPLKGPLLSYESRRSNAMKFTDRVLQSMDTLKTKSVFICGRWYTQLAFLRNDPSSKTIVLADYLSKEKLLKYIEQGFDIYYLPQQDYFNLMKYDYDVRMFGATAFAKR